MTDICRELEFVANAHGGDALLSEAAHEIRRLQSDINGRAAAFEKVCAHIEELRAEIERLRLQVTQRGARMQVMRDYLTQYSGSSTTLWRDFCRVRPEAAKWFDSDGVPV